MEEQKINSKEVKMQPMAGGKQDTKENPQEKLPYDKLKEIADSLWNENRYLKQQLQGASESLRSINRLDYLLRVVEIAGNMKDYSFDAEFVEGCLNEIQKIMTPPEEETKESAMANEDYANAKAQKE
jgi:hypothetical protein